MIAAAIAVVFVFGLLAGAVPAPQLRSGAAPVNVKTVPHRVTPPTEVPDLPGFREVPAPPRPAQPALGRARPLPHFAEGARLGTITIARLRETEPFFEGTAADVLAGGPGHYPSSVLPGQLGTFALAGHRVTHTRPFLRLNLLRKGDPIVVKTNWGRFVYRVSSMRIVSPNDVWVLRGRATREQLVLTACHPPRTAIKRIVVFAQRVD